MVYYSNVLRSVSQSLLFSWRAADGENEQGVTEHDMLIGKKLGVYEQAKYYN